MKLVTCISKQEWVLNGQNGLFEHRPNITNAGCNVFNDVVGQRMLVVFGEDHEPQSLMTSNVQEVENNHGLHVVMTRNSAYIFRAE